MNPSQVPLVAAPSAPRVLSWLDAILTRLGVEGPLPRDAVLACVVAVGSIGVLLPVLGPVAGQLGLSFEPGERVALVLLVGVQALLLALRRARPVACLLCVTMLQLGFTAVLPTDEVVRLAAPVMAAYSAGACLSVRTALRAVGTALGLEVLGGAAVATLVTPGVRAWLVGADAVGPAWSSAIPVWVLGKAAVVLLYVGASLAGMVFASRRRYAALVREQAVAAIAQEQARVRAAVTAERSRMARELHDIAAHHLSGLVVQAAAVERLIDRDPAAAKRAARDVRAEGKATLSNLRAAVGVLREPVGPGPADGTRARELDVELGAPVPGLAVVASLLDAARASGDDLDIDLRGEPYALPPLVDVTVYRVLQESLANARQHAPGRRVRVDLEWGPAQVRLEVVNQRVDGAPELPARSGYGLVGMRERAQLSNATLDAGPVGRDWRVRLTASRPAPAPRRPSGEEAS